jgi:dissimilatory sulfite reductase (desulfoviridin) alpha/beta subunit
LQLAKKSGQLLFSLRQVPFHLSANIRYVVDFVEFWADGTVRFVDIKGFRTPMYKLKKKQVEAEYPITIIEI